MVPGAPFRELHYGWMASAAPVHRVVIPTQLAGASLDRAPLSKRAPDKARPYSYSSTEAPGKARPYSDSSTEAPGKARPYSDSIDVGSRQGSSILLLYRRGFPARLVQTVGLLTQSISALNWDEALGNMNHRGSL